ncbi:HDOD domain-containing protein [Fontivita pretiosa]|uniref:HDOD domain-containing protein n=1 Tax=Fontivita pretiosa TaxID=2989684 RepID=UPI003D16FAEC
MNTILIVDDMAIFRETIEAVLRAEGYGVLTAQNAGEALAIIAGHQPDLVLLDLHLPDLNGAQVLRQMRSDRRLANTPVILLTADEKRDSVLQAARLGVQGYLIKSQFSLKDLLTRLRRHLGGPPAAHTPDQDLAVHPTQPIAPAQPSSAATSTPQNAQIPRLLTREQCIQRAESALQARTLSGVVAQVAALAASPHADVAQVAALVSRDLVLSARVLQAANSAAYTARRGVISTVADAVRHIGCDAVRNITATVGIFDSMPDIADDGFSPIRCWQHSLAVAKLCEQLAGQLDQHAATAYLVGLCHDLGEILFHTHFAAELKQVLQAQAQTGLRRDHLERQMLGVTHNDLVVIILRCMGLPDAVRAPIEALHSTTHAAAQRAHKPIDLILRIANLYANGLLLASASSSRVAPVTRADCRHCLGQTDPPRPDAARFRAEIVALTLVLARMSPAEQSQLAKPLYSPTTARIWLARHPSYSAFCPMQTALESLAHVDVQQRLPTPDELAAAQHDGVVIVAPSGSTPGFTASQVRQVTQSLGDDTSRVLWLCGSTQPTPAPSEKPEPSPLCWPIPLEALAQYVAHLPAPA